MSTTQSPAPQAVALTYSQLSFWNQGQQPYSIPNVQNFDGSLPVAASSDTTIVQDISNFVWDAATSTFTGGMLQAQAKTGTATVTVTLDGQPAAIFNVSNNPQPLESADGATLGAYIPPAPQNQTQTAATAQTATAAPKAA